MHTRRQVLRTAMYAAGLAALPPVLAACGKDEPAPAPTPQGPSLQRLTGERLAGGAQPGLNVFKAADDFAIGVTNYVGLGLVSAANQPIVAGSAQVWMVPSADPKAAVEPQGPFAAPWYGYSSPQQGGTPGINAADLRFDRPGVWTLLVEVDSAGTKTLGTLALTVQAEPKNKGVGDKAIASKTPTLDDNRGVDPICTRKPPCPMHEVTLASAIRSGKPVAFIFGTPAFCESRTCGPNLEELLQVRKDVGNEVVFIHAEVYINDQEAVAKRLASPTFKEWAFQSEPWIYLIDRKGTIAARYEGPVVASRINKDLKPLLG